MRWSQIWAWICGTSDSRDLRISALEEASEELASKLLEESQITFNLRRELEISKARQISAESISSERKSECLRLIEELRISRAAYQSVLGERLKSLDSLNIRLLSPRASETPDLAAFKALQEKAYEAGEKQGASVAVLGAVRSLKSQAQSVDRALLETLHPRFKRPAPGYSDSPAFSTSTSSTSSSSSSSSLEPSPDGTA